MMTTLETSFENFVAPGRRKTQKRKSKSKEELVLRIHSLPERRKSTDMQMRGAGS